MSGSYSWVQGKKKKTWCGVGGRMLLGLDGSQGKI